MAVQHKQGAPMSTCAAAMPTPIGTLHCALHKAHAGDHPCIEFIDRPHLRDEPTDDELRFIRKFPDKCCAEVTRRGESQPCDLVAVAVAISTEAYDLSWWPVCRKHLRGRELVPLEDVVNYVGRRVTGTNT